MLFSKPFGPTICKFKITEHHVAELNSYADHLLNVIRLTKDNKDIMKKYTGFHGYELEVPMKEMPEIITNFSNQVLKYFDEDAREQRQVDIMNAWFNCMNPMDTNPLHHHKSECSLVMVGFLKLPKNLEQEHLEELELLKLGAARTYRGFLNLVHGSPSNFSNSLLRIKPVVGDFYIFPSDILHSVNPYCSEGERRTLAVNFSTKVKNIS